MGTPEPLQQRVLVCIFNSLQAEETNSQANTFLCSFRNSLYWAGVVKLVPLNDCRAAGTRSTNKSGVPLRRGFSSCRAAAPAQQSSAPLLSSPTQCSTQHPRTATGQPHRNDHVADFGVVSIVVCQAHCIPATERQSVLSSAPAHAAGRAGVEGNGWQHTRWANRGGVRGATSRQRTCQAATAARPPAMPQAKPSAMPLPRPPGMRAASQDPITHASPPSGCC